MRSSQFSQPLSKPEDFRVPYSGDRKETYLLEVPLSTKELEQRRLRLGKVSTERETLAKDHAEAQAKWKEEHKKLEDEFNSLCQQLGSGNEAREIECEWEIIDAKKRTVRLRRLDTKELVFKSRKLEHWEFTYVSQENMLDGQDDTPEGEEDIPQP